MADLFDVSVGGVGFHFTSHLIALAALFIACFAIAGYITFRENSIPGDALKDAEGLADEDIHAVSLTTTGDVAVGGSLTNRKPVTVLTHNGTGDNTRVLTEAESGTLYDVDLSGAAAGEDWHITLPLAGNVSTATTITTGLFYDFVLTKVPGSVTSDLQISTGDDAVNMMIVQTMAGADTGVNSSVVNAGHSLMSLIPDVAAEAQGTTIRCRSITSTLWYVDVFEPGAAVTNITSTAGAAFA